MENRALYPTAVILLLVALRLTIGWYFFESGRSKNLDRNFSSAGFLSQAKGPLAPLYQSGLPDYHGFTRHMAIARKDKPNPHPPGSPSWAELQAAPYAEWQEQIVFDLGRMRQSATAHYQYTEQQASEADKVFAYYEGQLADYLQTNRDALAAYRHELSRLDNWQSADSAADVPYEQGRIAAKRMELKASAAQFQAAVTAIEHKFLTDLADLVGPQAARENGPLPVGGDRLADFDRFLMVSHFLIGGCLVVGFLSRFAACSAALFLLTVILSQPPWIVGYSTIGYQVVMLIGCLLLVVTPSGRWCGIDHFMPTIRGGSRGEPSGPELRKNA